MAGPAVLQDINKAVGYTPNLGYGGSSGGRVYAPAPSTTSVAPRAAAPQSSYPDYGAQLAGVLADIQGLRAENARNSYLPAFDLQGNYSRAQQQAAGAVNPVYTDKLNTYLRDQAIAKQRKQEDVTTANKSLDEALGNALEASGIARSRTAQDTQTNLNTINTQSDQFQQDSGNDFEQNRLNLLRNTQGAAEGLGGQQVASFQKSQNTAEGRQAAAFNQQKEAQNLLKTRTFEDLGRADTLSTKQTGQQKDAVKLDLDRYLQDLVTQEEATRKQLEAQRQQDLYAQTQQYAKTGVNKFLNTLSGSGLRNAASTYGSLY